MRSGPPFGSTESVRVTRPARIYTRGGDDGTTGLFGGERLPKNSLRIECFGTIDEGSSVIGLARHALADAGPRFALLEKWLSWTQDVLFNLGSELAVPAASQRDDMPHVVKRDVEALEACIDAVVEQLPPLTQFIHPGGSTAGALLHFARAVCRRAERLVAALARAESVSPVVLQFVNRLSDALFVWARYANHVGGEPEHIWDPAAAPPQGTWGKP
jgi:cob(I)alamin adenosyltransferase